MIYLYESLTGKFQFYFLEVKKMFDYRQYKRGYFMPPVPSYDWVKKEYSDKAPIKRWQSSAY